MKILIILQSHHTIVTNVWLLSTIENGGATEVELKVKSHSKLSWLGKFCRRTQWPGLTSRKWDGIFPSQLLKTA
jgi:hypothetical protein